MIMSPCFSSAPAVGRRLTVTSPREEASFRDCNAGKPYPERVRPWNFLFLAHPTQAERARPARPKVLIAPFRARSGEATCRRLDRPQQSPRWTGQDTRRPDARGSRRKRRRSQLCDYFEDYRLRPEAEALRPTDSRAIRGLADFSRRGTWVRAESCESVRRATGCRRPPAELDEEGVVEYPRPRTCPGSGLEIGGRRKWCAEACRKRAKRREGARVIGYGVGMLEGILSTCCRRRSGNSPLVLR